MVTKINHSMCRMHFTLQRLCVFERKGDRYQRERETERERERERQRENKREIERRGKGRGVGVTD